MTERHADMVTIDHILELRKEIRRLEKLLEFYTVQADNSSRAAYDLFIENNALKHKLKEHHGTHVTDQ